MRATERRTRLWLIVFRRREVTVAELAEELRVSVRTIKYDLADMTHFYPINTVRGRYGGCVKLQDCLPSTKGPLTDQQIDFLIDKWSEMQGEDASTMAGIISVLTLPYRVRPLQ
jgi:predicted DNA-binding transcriptional regulator YafY